MHKLSFSEDQYIVELSEYIFSTYKQHYAGEDKIQTIDYIMSQCDSPDFMRGNILKYAARYGKKYGYNRDDLFKILHYTFLMLYYHDNRIEKELQKNGD